jgi:hypothetical protein
MGTVEVVSVLVGSGALTALIRSLHLWIKYRQPKVHVKIIAADGRQVVVDGTNAGDVESVLKGLRGQ